MAFDAHQNLAIATVATAPTPPGSGTSLTVAAGQGAIFPVAPFTVTVWPTGAVATPTTAEIIRVTAKTGDVFTLTRQQEGTLARAIVVGDLIAATVTVKTLTDIESGTNFPQIVTPTATIGPLKYDTLGFHPVTTDGADTGRAYIGGGGELADPARGAWIGVGGNEGALPGIIQLGAGNVSGGGVFFYTGAVVPRQQIHASGGITMGASHPDPGPNNLRVDGNIDATGTVTLRGPTGAVTLTAATFITLIDRVAALEARLAALTPPAKE